MCKVTLVFALIILQLSAFCSPRQDGQRFKLTIRATNVPLRAVFDSITDKAHLEFFYDNQLIDDQERITVHYIATPLADILNDLLKSRHIGWTLIKNKYLRLTANVPASPDTIAVNAPGGSKGIAPDYLTGQVLDGQGMPLPYATVMVKGTKQGTNTDDNGRFMLKNIRSGAHLEVRFTGYVTRDIVAGTAKDLIIRLEESVSKLDENIVIAYGTTSRRKLTGSVGRIIGSEIGRQAVLNPLQALQGQVPGLQITQTTGVVGGNFKVLIRGQNSLRNGNNDNGNLPFYIIDGVPFSISTLTTGAAQGIYSSTLGANPLNSINPSEIESVEVLKDADATAIYGSRGANGVILITTKKGRAGKMVTDLNFYTGYGKVTRIMKLLHTNEYITMRKEGYRNDGVTSYPANAYDINGTWDSTRYTDWQKELIGGTAKIYDGQASISGGSSNNHFRFGTGYHKETTVFPGDFKDQRISFHISSQNYSSNNRFKSDLSVNYSGGVSDLLVQDLTSFAIPLAPNRPALLDTAGNLNWPAGVFTNPLAYTKQPYQANTSNLIGNLTLSYEILPHLLLKSSFGYTNLTMKEISKFPLRARRPATQAFNVNSSDFGNSGVHSWIAEPQLTYSHTFSNHQVSVLAGSTFQEQDRQSTYQHATGFISEALMDNISAVPPDNVFSHYSNSKYRYNAVFARFNYSYRDRYLVNFTGRRDGSSRFGPGRQFANFAALGTAWIFSDEPFINNRLPFLSFGKLRASYGLTGNDQIGDYGYLDTYSSQGAGQYQNVIGLTPSKLFNTNFAWETNWKMETGLELGVLEDLILFTMNYYRTRSSNQLVGYTLPPTTGFSSIQANLPANVQNKGLEFEVNTTNIHTKRVSWTTSFNISFPKNKLLSYPNIAGSSYQYTYVVGQPLSIRNVYTYSGVNAATGLYEVEDINNDHNYNLADKQRIEFLGQQFYGGLSNRISVGSISASFLVQFIKQRGNNYINNFSVPGALTNQLNEVLGRWKQSGDIASVQQYGIGSAPAYMLFAESNAAVSDASFIRLKNIYISYSLNERITQQAKLQCVRVFVQGQNLFTLTNYKGLDPETQGMVLPPLRVLTAGINISL